MSTRLSFSAFVAASLLLSFNAGAAVPASGSLTVDAPVLNWTGDAPFLVTNVTPASGEPTCAAEPAGCDNFALTVDIADEFRADEANKKETIRITVSWPNATGAGDFDVYFYDAADNLIGESATSANPEIIVVPMSVLKNGDYRFMTIPFAPLGDNYDAVAQIGKSKSANEKSLSISPMVAAPFESVAFDARSLVAAGVDATYTFDFGDGNSLTNDTGMAEHVYSRPAAYLARVTVVDARKVSYRASQTVAIEGVAAVAKSGSGLLAGSFGLISLLSLFGLAGLRKFA